MVFCVGEALVDLVMTRPGREEYFARPGGAPANCAAAVARLGGESAFVGKVGDDRFGHLVRETLIDTGVDCSRMVMDPTRSTSLAFAAIDDTGDRHFTFYRPSYAADLMLSADELSGLTFTQEDTLCFGSCCLLPSPTRGTLAYAVRAARQAGAIIAMDVNIRLPLWKDSDLNAALREFVPYADVVKMSEEEYPLVTGQTVEADAARWLLSRSADLVFITRGERGASVYSKDGRHFSCDAPAAAVVDTVGAGDAFTGTVLYSLDGCGQEGLKDQNLPMILDFATAAATLSTTRPGGIPAMPTFAEVMAFSSHRHPPEGDSLPL